MCPVLAAGPFDEESCRYILQMVCAALEDEFARVDVYSKNVSVDDEAAQDRTILDAPRRAGLWPTRFRDEYGQSRSGVPFLTVSRFIRKVKEILILTATGLEVEVVW